MSNVSLKFRSLIQASIPVFRINSEDRAKEPVQKIMSVVKQCPLKCMNQKIHCHMFPHIYLRKVPSKMDYTMYTMFVCVRII